MRCTINQLQWVGFDLKQMRLLKKSFFVTGLASAIPLLRDK